MSQEKNPVEEEAPAGASNTGTVRGVPGPTVMNVGVLDLRGASVEDLAKLERVKNVGTILISPGMTGDLANAVMENVGGMVEATEADRVVIGPVMEIDRAMLEGMPDNQRLIVIGILAFANDAPAELIAQKFELLRLTGILIAPAPVRGALLGKMEHTGIAVTVSPTSGGVIRTMGEQKVTAGYLSHIKPDSAYINIGRTEFDDSVTLDQLKAKISAYYNVGATVARQELREYLQANCAANMGVFLDSEEDKAPPA